MVPLQLQDSGLCFIKKLLGADFAFRTVLGIDLGVFHFSVLGETSN